MTPPAPAVPAAVAGDRWLAGVRGLLVGLLGLLVAGIAALAFWTSFEAISEYAARSGGIAPAHAWAVPLLVDSFIAVATGADLWMATTAHQRRWWAAWWPKLLLAGAATVSFLLNVAHAEPTLAARAVAAIPPAALVLSVELLTMVARRATTLRAAHLTAADGAAAARVPAGAGTPAAAPAGPTAARGVRQGKQPGRVGSPGLVRAEQAARRLAARGEPVTGRTLGAVLGVDPRSGRRWLARLQQAHALPPAAAGQDRPPAGPSTGGERPALAPPAQEVGP